MGGGQLHLVVDAPGAHVEHAAEEAGEAAGVVDLVRIVGAAGGHHADVGAGFLRHDLGRGIGHGEDDGIPVHGLDVLEGDHAGAGEPHEDVGALEGVARRAAQPFLIGVLGEPLLHRVHVVGAPAIDGARPVTAHDVARALQHEELGGGDAGGARSREDDAHVGELLAHHLESVDEGGEDHHRRAVLVVVEHGDVELALEALLDLEAARGRDVFEIDAAEDGGDGLHDHHDLVHALGVEAEGEGIDPRE